MTVPPRFSHVALTLPARLFEPGPRAELLGFYDEVLGWREDPAFARDDRILLRAPSPLQYLTLRRAETPMVTSGYEHLGVEIASEDELRAVHERAARAGAGRDGFELGPVRTLYDEVLVTFRMRFRLPLTLELQHFRRGAATP